MDCDVNSAKLIAQRHLVLPFAWKSLICVACLVFPFSLLWPTLLTCSGRASVTATHDTHGIKTMYQEKLEWETLWTFRMLFRVVQGLHSAIFSFLLIFFRSWQKNDLILLEYSLDS